MGNSTLPLGGGDRRRISEFVLQTAHGFSVGAAVRPDPSNPGEFILAQADSAENAEAVGIIETATPNDFEVVYQGKINFIGFNPYTDPNWPPVATGEVWFLSDANPGELTLTPPSAAGSVIKAMLVVSNHSNSEGIVTGYIGVQIGSVNTVNLNNIQPVGAILPWAAPASTPVPIGWKLCNGDPLDTTEFAELFAVISYDYGGAGSVFNLPDFQRRVPVGQDPTAPPLDPFLVQGNTGGQETYTPTSAELPPHDHTHDILLTFNPGGGTPYNAVVQSPSGTPTPNIGSSEYGPGGGVAGNNLQPYLVINFIIRVTEQASAAILDHDLGDHSDVDDTTVSSPNDCDVLKFNSGSGLWEAAPIPATGPAGTAVNSFRNLIINGQFDIWQRDPVGPITQGPGPGNFYQYTADRWAKRSNTDGGTVVDSVARVAFSTGQTDVPGQPGWYVDVEGDISGGGADSLSNFVQAIENVRTLNGKQVTVSFWAKATNDVDYITVGFAQDFGTGGSPSAGVAADAFQRVFFTTAGVWEYFEFTFTLASISGKTLGTNNDDNLQLRFYTSAGSNITFAQAGFGAFNYSGTVSFSNVQVEQGAAATAFEKRTFATELGLCQRYFTKNQDIETLPSTADGPSTVVAHGSFATDNFTIFWPRRMRAIPTVTFLDTGTSGAFSSVDRIGESSAKVTFSTAPSAQYIFNYTADAEL